jgi:hypothetical protein
MTERMNNHRFHIVFMYVDVFTSKLQTGRKEIFRYVLRCFVLILRRPIFLFIFF